MKQIRLKSNRKRTQTGYTYPEEYPRGGSTGWGVYSRPAGPKTLKEVP